MRVLSLEPCAIEKVARFSEQIEGLETHCVLLIPADGVATSSSNQVPAPGGARREILKVRASLLGLRDVLGVVVQALVHPAASPIHTGEVVTLCTSGSWFVSLYTSWCAGFGATQPDAERSGVPPWAVPISLHFHTSYAPAAFLLLCLTF